MLSEMPCGLEQKGVKGAGAARILGAPLVWCGGELKGWSLKTFEGRIQHASWCGVMPKDIFSVHPSI